MKKSLSSKTVWSSLSLASLSMLFVILLAQIHRAFRKILYFLIISALTTKLLMSRMRPWTLLRLSDYNCTVYTVLGRVYGYFWTNYDILADWFLTPGMAVIVCDVFRLSNWRLQQLWQLSFNSREIVQSNRLTFWLVGFPIQIQTICKLIHFEFW